MRKPQPAYNPGHAGARGGECMECDHFKMPANREGYQDWVRGGCALTGCSTVPPRWTCSQWVAKRKKRDSEQD